MDPIPSEIWIMILEHLASVTKIAQYATVCRKWQAVIEKLNFHSLSLSARDGLIPDSIMAKRNSLIKYIWYSIELPDYGCSKCSHWDSPRDVRVSSWRIKDGIDTMFQALSKHQHLHSRGMTLDLSIHSLSDAEHYFKHIRFEPANIDPANALSRTRMKEKVLHHVPEHSMTPPFTAVERIMSVLPFSDFDASGLKIPETDERFWSSVPQVPCVTRLLLRRQTRRRWDPPTITRLLALFPNLEDLVIEP
ncbi:unnamed protein product [Periconia digitata]|uniref:F-box domain-containing protein n=1 Tax=Periconia digitata TaxID=1303443 RepID=A0A9W4XQK0_9PLEO|nr:unnamed protein product [Periconia digitata]